jgi:hypothetical protein
MKAWINVGLFIFVHAPTENILRVSLGRDTSLAAASGVQLGVTISWIPFQTTSMKPFSPNSCHRKRAFLLGLVPLHAAALDRHMSESMHHKLCGTCSCQLSWQSYTNGPVIAHIHLKDGKSVCRAMIHHTCQWLPCCCVMVYIQWTQLSTTIHAMLEHTISSTAYKLT